MVYAIRITISGDFNKAIKSLNRFQKLPDMTSDGMMEWGMTLEKDMKNSAKQAGIEPFTGEVYGGGIEWRQRPRGRVGRLFIRAYLVQLDQMRPHWVNITKQRTTLLAWAMQPKHNLSMVVGANAVASGFMKKYPIYVKPHPFIRNGYIRARSKLNPILQNYIRRV